MALNTSNLLQVFDILLKITILGDITDHACSYVK